MMTALIDADSLIYIISYNHKSHEDEVLVKQSCDSFLNDIMLLTQATHYIGVFSDKKNFRHRIYKYAEYKGNRKEKDEWVVRWEPVIKEYFISKHGFIVADDLEADDVVAAICSLYKENTIICSPDKDLKQISGFHFDYAAKVPEGQVRSVKFINDAIAHRNFWTQVMMGDMGDNVYGVPGMGPAKTDKLFDDALDPMQYPFIVEQAYHKYFQPYYGAIILGETIQTIMMMGPKHPLWKALYSRTHLNTYNNQINQIMTKSVRTLDVSKGLFDITS